MSRKFYDDEGRLLDPEGQRYKLNDDGWPIDAEGRRMGLPAPDGYKFQRVADVTDDEGKPTGIRVGRLVPIEP